MGMWCTRESKVRVKFLSLIKFVECSSLECVWLTFCFQGQTYRFYRRKAKRLKYNAVDTDVENATYLI
jgi:hypothetical protein